jgi:hypothetical protein
MNVSEKRITISPDVLVQTIDDEIILLNMKTEKYFGLDEISADIWQLLEQHKNTKDVLAAMLLRYDVDRPTLSQDINSLIGKFSQAGLIKSS